MSKFRCGVAPIRLETGRYERLSEIDRVCPLCHDGVEDEKHVLILCPVYTSIRAVLYEKATEICNGFRSLTDENKVNFILSNDDIVRFAAKSCFQILEMRKTHLYSR